MNKVVVVLGGSGGLGREIAWQFALNGDKVVLNDIAHLDIAEGITNKITESGGEAFVYKADICDYEQVNAMVEAILDRWDSIDVLVNTAGGYKGPPSAEFQGQSVIEMEEEEWHKVIDINLKGPFICIKAVAPQMIKQGKGHIINIASRMAFYGGKGFFAYSAAKAGVISLTKSAARDLGEYNIQVNVVSPAVTPHEDIAKVEGHMDRVNRYIEQSLIHRVGTADEFAGFIVHLAGMENITGQVLALDMVPL